jgi:hypothetical protein
MPFTLLTSQFPRVQFQTGNSWRDGSFPTALFASLLEEPTVVIIFLPPVDSDIAGFARIHSTNR